MEKILIFWNWHKFELNACIEYYIKHLPSTGNISWKMLQVLGKFIDLKFTKITKNHKKNLILKQKVSSYR